MLKSLFSYASREYGIKNTLKGLIMPKCEKTEIQLLSTKEQKTLINYVVKKPSLTNLGIAISLYTGIRIGELCALQWGDIDFKKRILTVKKTVQRIQNYGGNTKTKLIITSPKSRSSIREIPLPKFILSVLEKFRNNDYIYILSGKVKPIEPRTMQYRFKKILKNVNLPSVHFHSLRHTFATKAIELGFDVKTLSEILGHSSVEITLNRYIHSSLNRKRTCMEKLDLSA